MSPPRVFQRLVDLLARDVGRKLLALLFAFVLFEVLDRQVQSDDTLTLRIAYVDENDLGQVPENPDEGSVLLIAERGGAGKPLVVANFPRPQRATLRMRASKDALERAKSRRHRLVWRLGKEGPVEPSAAEFEGIDALLEELGTGARVELQPRLHLDIEAEEVRSFVLADGDVEFVGAPASGYDLASRTIAFRPPEVLVVGPHSVIADAQRRRPELFDKVQLDGKTASVSQPLPLSSIWKGRLRLFDGKNSELDAIHVACEFARKMVPLPGTDGRFELAVQVLYNDDRLHASGEGKSFRDGWRLDLPKAVNGELRLALQVLVPDTQVSGATPDRARVELAKENVELVVRAHEASGVDRTTLPVHIERFKDFPDGLEIVFADGQRDAQVEVAWRKPEGGGARPAEDKDKKAGHGE